MACCHKKAIDEINDETDANFDDDELKDSDELEILEAKENGASIQKLLKLLG